MKETILLDVAEDHILAKSTKGQMKWHQIQDGST